MYPSVVDAVFLKRKDGGGFREKRGTWRGGKQILLFTKVKVHRKPLVSQKSLLQKIP